MSAMATTDMTQRSELFFDIQDCDAEALQGGLGVELKPDVLISRGFLAILLYNRLGSVPAFLISKLPTTAV